MALNLFTENNLTKFVQKLQILCNTEVLESHNVDNDIFPIFGKVTSIPEILGSFTNVVWQ